MTATATGETIAPETQKKLTDQQLQERLNAADAVVVGQVMDVHPWIRAGLAAEHPRFSEHDPDWHEAVIQVKSAIKGTQAKQIVVRFPASRDVAWHRAPKFQKGQSGTFLLKNDQISGSPMTMLAGTQVKAFTAIKREDVLPATEEAHIRALLTQ
jgi:hypothetical protein